MKSYSRSILVPVLALGFLFGGAAWADSPAVIHAPDRHSVEVSGKVSLYRVQVEGMDLGKGRNKAHAEVFVSLDSKPGMIYTLALHENDNADSAANAEMAETLRTAFVNRLPVTLYRQISVQKDNNFKILMVQLD